VLFKFTNHDVLELTPHKLNRCYEQVVGEWSGRLMMLHATVDARGLKQTNHDGKRPVALNFFKINNLLVVNLTNNDA